MSNVLHILGKLDHAEKSKCVRTIVRVLLLEGKLTEEVLGKRLDRTVSQTTISRWANGDLPPERQFQQLLELFFGSWHYVCSFSENYYPSLALDAREALFRSRAETPLIAQAPMAQPMWEKNIYLRSGKLVPGALAHTFANHPSNPTSFVVLIRDDLTDEESERVGREEVLAHVLRTPRFSSGRGLPVEVSLRQHFSEPSSDNNED
jgi:hypothetical protein